MSGNRDEMLHRAFMDVLEHPIEDRESYVRETWSDDPELVTTLLGLLNYDPGSTRLPLRAGLCAEHQQFKPSEVLADRYRVKQLLASGGMGDVYLAEDMTLEVKVALKTIRSDIARNPDSRRRFQLEYLLPRFYVSHPNICQAYDLGRHSDQEQNIPLLTMEYLPGETLSSRIRARGSLTQEEALPIVRQLAAALDAAHQNGVVHRDFKSANIMLVPSGSGERAVITDFGLAFAIEASGGVGGMVFAPPTAAELATTIVGTPAYMSPEQVQGESVNASSDLYALGVVLFEMVTGRLPFQRATAYETARARLEEDPPAPSSMVEIDPAWDNAILRLMARNPNERFARASDVVRALEHGAVEAPLPRYALPAEQDEFVGRAEELAVLASRLEDGPRPFFLTVVGTAGAGKTRLARHYGWTSLEHWPGGVWFCDLSEAQGVEGITRAVATALNVPLDKGDPITQLGHAIAGRGRSRVILDNFEHLVDHAESTLCKWLERAFETRFLVTSRERLRLPGEVTLDLQPLEPLIHGVELFEVRAREHRPRLELDAATRSVVEGIVTLLEGLPLAIELVASRLRVFSLMELRHRLDAGLMIAGAEGRDRHATMKAVLEWSWGLLLAWERSAVAQLSVFEGGFTLEAAEAVVDVSGWAGAPPVLDVVQSLAASRWLRTRVALQTPRFEMNAAVQEYAREQLRATGWGEGRAAEKRHGHWFAQYGTEEAIASLKRHGNVQRRRRLEQEIDNLTAACRRAIRREGPEVAVATFMAAEEVLTLRGPLGAAVDLGGKLLAMPLAREDRARVLGALGSAERVCGQVQEARDHYEAALAIYREMGNRRAEGILLASLGTVHFNQGRMKEAREYYEAALSIHREVGDRLTEGAVLGNLGNLHHEQGRVEEARSCYEAALAIHREVGNHRDEGVMLNNLGLLHQNQGRMKEARSSFMAALAIQRNVGDRRIEGGILGNLGILNAQHGQMEEAHGCFAAALSISREVGDRRGEGDTLGSLGQLHSVQGRLEEARGCFEAALSIHRGVGDRLYEGIVLGGLGIVHRAQGRLEEARSCYEAAQLIFREVGSLRMLGDVLSNLGNLHCHMGRMEEARAVLAEGEALLREVDDPMEIGKILCIRAEIERTVGAMDAAWVAFSEAEALADQIGAGSESELGRELVRLRQALAVG